MAILPVSRSFIDTDTIDIKSIGNFKRWEGEISLTGVNFKTMKAEKFLIGNSKYSVEFLEKAKKIAKIFYNNDTPVFYKVFEKDFVEDQPIIINFGTMYFLLAPRVEEN